MNNNLTIGSAVNLGDTPERVKHTLRTSLPLNPPPARTSAMELATELFKRACITEGGKYDHQGIGIYEGAQQQLIEWGMIKAEDCLHARK